uniref:Uncharacterized protein n=1 Tax=Timema tahoe TaxID=61484 RepID=A0A7R9NVF1_9NEOP|nr:unnamed protein product [Timema tahoe]
MAASRKASSWEESETVQRRRSVVLAAAGGGGGGGLLSATECHRSHLRGGDMIILPASSELMMMDKRDLRYYFQHPYSRLFVTYFVIFCNFLLFAEDPISHSHTDTARFLKHKPSMGLPDDYNVHRAHSGGEAHSFVEKNKLRKKV